MIKAIEKLYRGHNTDKDSNPWKKFGPVKIQLGSSKSWVAKMRKTEKNYAAFLKKVEAKSGGHYCKREVLVHTAVVKLWNSSGARRSGTQLTEACTE